MSKRKDKRQFSLPLDANEVILSKTNKKYAKSNTDPLIEKKVITTSAFTEKRNEIKREIFSSIIKRAKHLYD